VAAQQRAPEVAAEPEPTLFQHLEPAEEEQRWEAETDDLPPPAYSPAAVAAAAARAQAQQAAASETYVAPAAQRPGTPSPEALRRLQQAVNRVPARQPQVAPPASQAPAADRGRFGLNSLINRMTGGLPAETERAGLAPRPQAAPSAAPQAPQRRLVAEEPEADPDHERIEIPAFLRRQAN
jgi:cell division protein FtsZ